MLMFYDCGRTGISLTLNAAVGASSSHNADQLASGRYMMSEARMASGATTGHNKYQQRVTNKVAFSSSV